MQRAFRPQAAVATAAGGVGEQNYCDIRCGSGAARALTSLNTVRFAGVGRDDRKN